MIKIRLTYLKNSGINLKNGLLFTLFAFVNNGVSFILLLILAKFLIPEDYGKLNLFNTFTLLCSILISLNAIGYINIYFFRVSKKRMQKIIAATILSSLAVLTIFLVILTLTSEYSSPIIGFSLLFQIFALIICFSQVITNLHLNIWRLEEKVISYGTYSLIMLILNAFLSLFFIIASKLGWEGRVYALLIVSITFAFGSTLYLIKRNYISYTIPSIKQFKKIYSFGIPLIPHSIANWLRQGADRYIINIIQGAAVVGFFSFAFNFANVINIIGLAYNASNSVTVYKQLSDTTIEKENSRKKFKKEIILMSIVFFLITLCIIVLAHIVIHFYDNYNNSLSFIVPMCFGAMFHCIYLLFVNFIFFFRKTKQLMYITFIISIFHVILSIVVVDYGAIYVAYAGLISNFVTCLLVALYCQKMFKIF